MEDALSRSSLDSSSNGEDFVMINGEPKLRITGDINDIGVEISDESSSDPIKSSTSSIDMETSDIKSNPSHVMCSSQSADVLTMAVNTCDKSFPGSYSKGRSASLPTTPGEEFTLFDGVTYLGCATVNAPRSEKEIYRNMAILNEQSQMSIPVTLSIPSTSEGIVRLIDPASQMDISTYRIHRILLCVRGPVESDERRCFAFTCSHGDTADTTIFQCHVYRCDEAEAVGKILYCFGTTFRRKLRSVQELSSPQPPPDSEQANVFNVTMEFKEDDGKGNFTTCPKDKNVFKFRCNFDKKIIINVQQTGPQELLIERCFGLLVSPGRNVKDGDMQLIEMESMGVGADGKSYVISGHWDPTEPSFAVLNAETPKDTRVFMTVAIDLVLKGIQEPVRFAIETKAKIFPQTDRFWYFTKKPHYEMFHVTLKQIESSRIGEQEFEVMNVQSQTDIDKRKKLTLNLPPNKTLPEEIQTPVDVDDPESDGDEPLLSGSGSVSKEVTDDNLLEAWRDVLTKWHQNLSQRPKQVTGLCRKGIPEALRGEVWQLITGSANNTELMDAYRVLIGKESPNEQTISRDINRTFPAHDFFKDSGGVGQESLYKISKAYSVYDEEIGYCQGLSFLAAALLLHMPEEQAFAVLVKIMFDYGLRDLFKSDFEELHLKFYQLERLMQDNLPDLYEHFVDMNLEAHMFASQWFLTLFTAKFPLHMVFHILDFYLSDGKDVIFSVAMSLLKHSRKDLLALDFEGILKYFRVHLPKRYRSDDAVKEVLQTACSMKVSAKKLKKYEKEFILLKEQEEDPLERYERENKKLIEANMRLEQENDDLAHELVTCKLSLRSDIDKLEDKCEILNSELLQSKTTLLDTEEEKRRLELESAQLKEMCRRELDRAETENSRNGAIISDYKQICSQLSERLEKQQNNAREELQKVKDQVKSCELCSKLFSIEGKIKLINPNTNEADENPTMGELEKRVRDLELELAQTKLALVESECKLQDQTHQLNSALSEIQTSKNTWFQKTLSSIKEAATSKKDPAKDPKERTGSEGS